MYLGEVTEHYNCDGRHVAVIKVPFLTQDNRDRSFPIGSRVHVKVVAPAPQVVKRDTLTVNLRKKHDTPRMRKAIQGWVREHGVEVEIKEGLYESVSWSPRELYLSLFDVIGRVIDRSQKPAAQWRHVQREWCGFSAERAVREAHEAVPDFTRVEIWVDGVLTMEKRRDVWLWTWHNMARWFASCDPGHVFEVRVYR